MHAKWVPAVRPEAESERYTVWPGPRALPSDFTPAKQVATVMTVLEVIQLLETIFLSVS